MLSSPPENTVSQGLRSGSCVLSARALQHNVDVRWQWEAHSLEQQLTFDN